MIRLRVWAHARPMGWFGHAAGEFFFEYDAQWLAQPGAYALAPQFALNAQPTRGALVRSFFENLLPEGEVLEDVLAALQLRDASTLALLPAWDKVRAAVAREKGVTEAERAMLGRMSAIFARHVDHALSMTARPVTAISAA